MEKSRKAAAAVAAEKELRGAVFVSASQLSNDYQANEVAADNKHKGKLLVTGTVASIDKGLSAQRTSATTEFAEESAARPTRATAAPPTRQRRSTLPKPECDLEAAIKLGTYPRRQAPDVFVEERFVECHHLTDERH